MFERKGNRQALIEALRAAWAAHLAPCLLDILDESDQHVGHAGAQGGGGHFHVTLASERFVGQSLLACHRLVYAAVAPWLARGEVHALRITVLPFTGAEGVVG